MVEHIHKCVFCGKYTLAEKCAVCGKEAVVPRPPKFSLEDKYAGMRREVKKKELAEKGWY